MSTTAAIRGKMGEYEYYQTTMKSKDVISKTSAAIDYFSPDDWEEMGEISRVQREPDFKRIMENVSKMEMMATAWLYHIELMRF